jgi:hypothetical protein
MADAPRDEENHKDGAPPIQIGRGALLVVLIAINSLNSGVGFFLSCVFPFIN